MAGWIRAKVKHTKHVADDMKSLITDIKPAYHAGQYFELQINGKNRPYSVVSHPYEPHLEFGVQLLEGGEVSPQLWGLEEGDHIELRGPWGDEFIWKPEMPEPLLLIGGGAGLAPLVSIARHHMHAYRPRQVIFLSSYKTPQHAPYEHELDRFAATAPDFIHAKAFTREAPAGWRGKPGRITREVLEQVLDDIHLPPRIYVSGSTPFVEGITQFLLTLGEDGDRIFAERFGGRLYE